MRSLIVYLYFMRHLSVFHKIKNIFYLLDNCTLYHITNNMMTHGVLIKHGNIPDSRFYLLMITMFYNIILLVLCLETIFCSPVFDSNSFSSYMEFQ